MNPRQRRFGLAISIVLATTCPAAPAIDKPPDDEQLFKTARIETDGPSLIAYFRSRTVTTADRQRIETLIHQLGDPAYAVRERASNDLVACGLLAVGPLRQAQADADVEVARRADRCLERIEKVPSAGHCPRRQPDWSPAANRPERSPFCSLICRPPTTTRWPTKSAMLSPRWRSRMASQTKRWSGAGRSPAPQARGCGRGAGPVGPTRCCRFEPQGARRQQCRCPIANRTGIVTRAKDKSAIPSMIGLLAELPQGSGWRIEDVLIRLAGDSAPKVTLGEDAASGENCRDAWRSGGTSTGPRPIWRNSTPPPRCSAILCSCCATGAAAAKFSK